MKFKIEEMKEDIAYTVMNIFHEANKVPVGYHKAKGRECDLAIGPEYKVVLVYNPSCPRENY